MMDVHKASKALCSVMGAADFVISKGKVYFLDNEGNAIAIMTFGAIFSLVILAVRLAALAIGVACLAKGIYAIAQIITVANISSDNALYAAIQAIPGGVVTIVGVVLKSVTQVDFTINPGNHHLADRGCSGNFRAVDARRHDQVSFALT